MTSERLFNSFIPPPKKKTFIPPKQISGYAPETIEGQRTDHDASFLIVVFGIFIVYPKGTLFCCGHPCAQQ